MPFSLEQNWEYCVLILSLLRVFLEFLPLKFNDLPLGKMLISTNDNKEKLERFHRLGLYLASGYLIFFFLEILFWSSIT